MGLGLTLSTPLTVSTTAGHQSLTFTAGGLAAVQSLITSNGKLTVCLMNYYFDYLNNPPVLDGYYHNTDISYMERGTIYRPFLGLDDGAVVQTVYAEDTGTDDDSQLANLYIGQSPPSWSTIRGDATTVGTHHDANISRSYVGIRVAYGTGRGAPPDIIFDVKRSYFVFDLSFKGIN